MVVTETVRYVYTALLAQLHRVKANNSILVFMSKLVQLSDRYRCVRFNGNGHVFILVNV